MESSSQDRVYFPTGTVMDDNPTGFHESIPLKTLRHQTSYENMNVPGFTDDSMDHQYDELQRKTPRTRPPAIPGETGNNRPTRKKVKSVNEAAKESAAESCDGGYHKDAFSNVFKVLVFGGFLFALVVFVVVLLLALGTLSSPSSCHECQDEVEPGQTSALSQELLQVIKELRSNVSELNATVKSKDELISQLQTQDVELTAKIAELELKTDHQVVVVNNTKLDFSSLVGSQGPPGFDGKVGSKGVDGLDGKPGERGIGNMTSCRYMSNESAPFTAETSGSGQNVIVTEQPGYRIIGVTCSTFGTSEYNFKSEMNSTTSVRQHECECRGQSTAFKSGIEQAKCTMHYWVCPLTS